MDKKDCKPVQVACTIDDDATYVFALEKMINIFNVAESVLHPSTRAFYMTLQDSTNQRGSYSLMA